MPGGLLKTTLEARAQRQALVAEAAAQRQQMGAYLDAFDPATVWLERLIGAVSFILARPLIPAGVLAALVVLKPRRALRFALLAWKDLAWLRRFRSLVG